MCIFKQGCQINGGIHISMMKNWASHVCFIGKRGLIIYLAAMKKGAIRHTHPYCFVLVMFVHSYVR